VPRRSHTLVVCAGTAYGLALLGIAIWPQHVDESLGLRIYHWYAVVEFVANIVLFVPFGALVMLSSRHVRWSRMVLGGLLVSGSVELVQAALLQGRTGSLQDVVANTIGATIGGGVVLGLRRAESRTSLGR
jgi:glycopeptide antibiotics resistance protein